VSVHIDIDASDALHELRRLEDGPDVEDLLRLDGVLIELYAQTQAVVHVQTGSLRASAWVDSRYADNERFEGEISYGGPTPPGLAHNPVRYAEYERDRGGAHDFLAPTYTGDPAWTNAVLAFLRDAAA
jgi:hypothetical protein